MKKISTRLKELRADKKITQSALAEKINVTQDSISLWETGRRIPDSEYLIKLADFFGCSIDYLCGREDDFGIIKKTAEVPALSREETELLTYFKKLNNLQQQKVIGYCYALCH